MMRSVKELLSSTVELYRAHFWLFIGYAAWMLVPTAAFLLIEMFIAKDNPWYVLIIPIIISGLFLYFWIISALTKLAHALSQQKLVDSQQLSTAAIQAVAPLFVTTFLIGLITTGGLLLLIVPGIIFSIWYSQATIVTVIEQTRPVASLTRSKQLVKGQFWDVLLYIFVGSLLFGLIYILILAIPTSIGAYITGMNLLDLIDTTEILIWPEIIQICGEILFTPIFIIYSVLLYQELAKTPLESEAKVA